MNLWLQEKLRKEEGKRFRQHSSNQTQTSKLLLSHYQMSDTEVWPFCFEFFFMKLNHSAAVCGTLSSFFQLMFVIWILRRGNYKWVNSIVKKNSLIFRWFVVFCIFLFGVFVFRLFGLLKLVILIVSVFHCACIICFLFTNSSPYAGSTSFKRKPYRFNCFERFMHSSM